MPEAVLIAIISAFTTLFVAVITVFGAKKLPKKLGLGANTQNELVKTLKDIVEAQNIKIELLELNKKDSDEKIAESLHRIEDLEQLTISQAKKISSLERLLRRTSRGTVVEE